jgi:hypothetical protein
MIHLLHAYLTDDCSSLGQEKTGEKSNEITAIPRLLEVLDLQGKTIAKQYFLKHPCKIFNFL